MLRDLIERSVILKPAKKGWHSLKCPLCNDYKFRAAFNFENDAVTYNCFNCSTKSKYIEGEQDVSYKMKEILNALGISENDIDLEVGKNFFNQDGFKGGEQQKPKCFTKEISLPDDSYLLREADEEDVWALAATEYLELRGLSINDYDWYLSKDPLYRTRIIIPYYRRGKIIYWQARSMDDSDKLRYLNPPTDKDAIIFGYNFLEEYTEKPLFVVEGVFDAIPIKGISLLGSTLNDCKIQALNSTRRNKVFVVDKDQNGYKLGYTALKHDWSISFVDGDVKDVNDAVQKYGKLWTLQNLMTNIKSGFEAKVYLETIKHSA